MPAVILATQESRCSLEYGRSKQWLKRHNYEYQHNYTQSALYG